jgi:hypothetical protein
MDCAIAHSNLFFVQLVWLRFLCLENLAMPTHEDRINPIEHSLLTDLVGLYTCDLKRESHRACHTRCIACSKQDIIRAISRYRELDVLARSQDQPPV